MNLAVGSDERTYLTDRVVEALRARGHDVALYGALRDEKETWTHVAQAVAETVARGQADEGILFCWTGTGVTIAANKVPGIRAALVADAATAKGARLWNRANVLCLSLRATSEIVAQEILDAWFATPLGTDPVDLACVQQVQAIESKYTK
jgi:ribose 5-phosphate isomerase B